MINGISNFKVKNLTLLHMTNDLLLSADEFPLSLMTNDFIQ